MATLVIMFLSYANTNYDWSYAKLHTLETKFKSVSEHSNIKNLGKDKLCTRWVARLAKRLLKHPITRLTKRLLKHPISISCRASVMSLTYIGKEHLSTLQLRHCYIVSWKSGHAEHDKVVYLSSNSLADTTDFLK